jgi:chaperonin GroES
MTSAFKRLIPTLNRILIRKFEVENKTKSGIILQENSDKTTYGEVIATGNGNDFSCIFKQFLFILYFF